MPLMAAACVLFTSCIKDELPNSECDIRKATIHLPRPQDYFVNLADTSASILPSFRYDVISFTGIKESGDSTEVDGKKVSKDSIRFCKLAPTFTISDGAVIYPMQGTPRDFYKKQQPYYVIAADTKGNYPYPDMNDAQAVAEYEKKLDIAVKNGEHIRKYFVQFISAEIEMDDVIEYKFDNYFLDKDGKYFEWSDLYQGRPRAVQNWATANSGISIPRGDLAPQNYPTSPIAVGGAEDGGPYVSLTTTSTGDSPLTASMPLAAGNLFLGEFDIRKGLTETLAATRFGANSLLGRKPLKFTGYYQYTPGAVYTDVHKTVIPGVIDTPAIYCVIYLNKDANGERVILNGNDVETNPNRVALAEVTDWIYTDKKEGWIAFEKEFTWFKQLDPAILKAHGYNFAIVCSSSKDGATFSGAVGSRLLVDNFRIINE